MNKVGFNVLAWSAVVSDDLFPIVERLKDIGYDGIECFIGSPDNAAYKRVGDHVRSLGMEATAVFVVGKDESPISEVAAIRPAAATTCFIFMVSLLYPCECVLMPFMDTCAVATPGRPRARPPCLPAAAEPHWLAPRPVKARLLPAAQRAGPWQP